MARNLRDPRLLAFYAVGFGVLFNFMAVFTYVSFHLAAPPYLLTPSMLGAIFVTYLAGTATAPLVGRAVGRLGRRAFVLGLIAVWAAGALLLLAPSLAVIIAGPDAVRDVRNDVPGRLDQRGDGDRGGRALVRRRALRDLVLCGRQRGGLAARPAWQSFGWPAAVAMTLAMLALMALVVALGWRGAEARG